MKWTKGATLKSKLISWTEHIRIQTIGKVTEWITDEKRSLKQRWVNSGKSDLQMLRVIYGEQLTNDR